MHRLHFFIGATLLSLHASLPLVAAAESPAIPPTAQRVYDQAIADFDKGDWTAAIKGFASVARPADGGPMSHSQGIIHVQLARAYAAHRETDKAMSEATLALNGLTAEDDTPRAVVWLAIGDAYRLDLAMPKATVAYERSLEAARKATSPAMVTRAQIGLAICNMTIAPEKAAALLDSVLAAPETASATPIWQAQLNDLRGRASLNLGQPRDARPFLDKAIKLSGGVGGTKVSLAQISIRGDAAIGAVLGNHTEDAVKYLAYTGAGHLASEEWNSGLGDPPVCSESSGISSTDMAVVEFSIGDDGRVIDATPIYASRPGTVGLSFAQSVSRWRWNPERIAALPSFWRKSVRIEMRCLSRPNPEALAEPFLKQTIAWLSQLPITLEDLAPLKDGYIGRDDPRLEHDNAAAIPALLTRLGIELDQKRADALALRLSAALDNVNAPAVVRAVAMNRKRAAPSFRSWSAEQVRVKAANLATLERTDPQSTATAWLTLEYAIALESNGRFGDARPVLEHVIAFRPDILGEHDPVRDVAVLHLAALQRRAGDAAGADSQVNAAGLTRAQCMLFDVRPVATVASVSGDDFPTDARRWGFDGFVREAFDINAAGHVENVRAIISYPPFIFRSSADRAVARFRFLAPVVDGGSAGCDGHAQNFNYRFAR